MENLMYFVTYKKKINTDGIEICIIWFTMNWEWFTGKRFPCTIFSSLHAKCLKIGWMQRISQIPAVVASLAHTKTACSGGSSHHWVWDFFCIFHISVACSWLPVFTGFSLLTGPGGIALIDYNKVISTFSLLDPFMAYESISLIVFNALCCGHRFRLQKLYYRVELWLSEHWFDYSIRVFYQQVYALLE